MSKIKKILTNWRVIVLIIFLVLAVVTIHPNPWNNGVAIRNVVKNSSAELAGIAGAQAGTPMSRERVLSINNMPVKDMNDYYTITSSLQYNRTIQVRTNKGMYNLLTKPASYTLTLNETENITVTESYFNETLNQTIYATSVETRQKTQTVYLYNQSPDLGLMVYEAPKTNLRKGLELQGGTRVILKPAQKVDATDMDTIISNLKERLNVYGLSDITVRYASDALIGQDNQYIIVEIAGVNEEEVKDLISKQGKFEAKIGNSSVFLGGKDVTYVCRTSECSFAIDPREGCNQGTDGNYYCRFSFSISLSPEAADRQAALTKDLKVMTGEGTQQYLSQPLDLYLDDTLVDTLQIGADLKGRAVTEISISGSGTGKTMQEAAYDSEKNMKRLQTILITGSLPVKLDIVKTDNISPVLGDTFIKNALFIALLAIIGVVAVILVRYRVVTVAGPIAFTMISEVVILLGFAALVGWNLDMAAIAGIIVAVGTGVDDQIVITDESLKGERNVQVYDWKARIKRAMFIILAAYAATVASMFPLLFAGAGLLKGFALTTIVGVSVGVFITRPAYASTIEILLKKD